ncbi:MAG: hypothetical protein ABW034_19315 [Steroidobacteraceae bacterium]
MEAGIVTYRRELKGWSRIPACVAEPRKPYGSGKGRNPDTAHTFALADMSNTLFVSRYHVQLPDKKEIEEFLQKAAKELREG